MTLEELQFGALLLTSVLTIDLASRSLRQAGKVYNLSRWLMVAGAIKTFFTHHVPKNLCKFAPRK